MNCEIHITLSTKDAEKATGLAKLHHWKTSEIARDPLLGDETYFHLTTHTAEADLAFRRMDFMSLALRDSGVHVIREKIEVIIYDTKRKPELGVANEAKV